MSDRMSLLESYRKLQITPWSTWDKGSIRDHTFPYSAIATCAGSPEAFRFGAFLGWVASMQWWVDLAGTLSLPLLDRFGLLEVEHQGAGHSCIPWFCVATPVSIHDAYIGFVRELCSHFFHAHGGWMDGVNVSEHEQYLDLLRTVGLTADCLSEFKGLMESVYPMDATDKNLSSLLAQPAKALTSLGPLLSDATARERLRIFVLADNSD